MNVLTPHGPFLLILWNPETVRCEVKGTLRDKNMALEMLDRARATLKDYYEEQVEQNLVERPRIQIPS